MESVQGAIELAFKEFRKKYGENTRFEDGDTAVFLLNNCTLIVRLEDGHLTEEFIGGSPIPVDCNVDVYEESEEK